MKKTFISLICVVILSLVLSWDADVLHPSACEVENFGLVRQPDDITCGPTSVLMLLNWYGHEATLGEIEVRAKTRWFGGENGFGMTVPMYMSSSLTEMGVPSQVRRGNLNNLKHYVSAGRLPIVLLRSGTSTWHYVVVTGYTEAVIICADPGYGRLEMPIEHFLGSWGFQTDMEGMKSRLPCPLCDGHGRYNWNASCDLCSDGTIDPLFSLLKEAGVHPRTMIVPDHSRHSR